MTELQFPNWQGPLQEAILEFDRRQFSEKALQVENLIFERLRELEQSDDGHTERSAIADGLSLLKLIKTDRLGLS